MPKQKSPGSYDDRYKMVFQAGALHWNNPRPNASLLRVLSQLGPTSECVEFGCGEGYQAYLASSLGHSVTAIDISITAIEKARRNAPSGSPIRFLVGDVTDARSLDLPDSKYDLAIDIGCLHIIVDDEGRSKYLTLVHRVLKRGGRLFLQDGLDLDDVLPQSEDEARQLAEARIAQRDCPDAPSPRTIMTPKGSKEISLPLIPAKMLSLDGYFRELEGNGFFVISSERAVGVNCSYEAVMVAEKL